MRELGFDAIPIERPNPHELEFCSSRLWPTTLGWAFIPKLGKTLLKIPFSLKVRPGVSAGAIARGTALSMYDASECVPPLRSYFDWILDRTSGVKAVFPEDQPWKMSTSGVGKATPETWLCLTEQYGWDVSLQREWEKELESFQMGKPSSSSLFMMLVDRDVSSDRQLWCSEEELSNNSYKEIAVRPDPLRDLTKEGIEPNPGPTIVEVDNTGRRVGSGNRSNNTRGRRNAAKRSEALVLVETNRTVQSNQGRSNNRPKITQAELERVSQTLRKANMGGMKNRAHQAPNLSVPSPFVPRGRGQDDGRKSNQIVSQSGSDFWQTIPGGTYVSGQVVLASPVTPSQVGPWLKAQAVLYEKWRLQMTMRYVSATGSASPGNLLMFFDPDPAVNWGGRTPDVENITEGFTKPGRCDFALWEQARATMKKSDWLYTMAGGSDPRLFQAGTFVVVAVTGFTVTNDVGSLHMDWSCDLKDRTYNVSAVTSTSFLKVFASPVNFAGATTASILLDLQQAATGAVNAGRVYYEMGPTVGRGSKAVQTVNPWNQDSGGPYALLALPPGEYLATIEIGTDGAPSTLPTDKNFLFPARSKSSSAVTIEEFECGLMNTSTRKGNSNPVANFGVTGSCIVTVAEDANEVGVFFDAPGNGSFYSVQNSQPTAFGNSQMKQSNDFGLFDWVFYATQALGTGVVNYVSENFTEIAASALSILLLQAPNSPAVQRHLASRKTMKIVTYQDNNGLGFSPEERAIISEMIRHRRNVGNSVTPGILPGNGSDSEPSSARSTSSGIVVPSTNSAWFTGR